MTTHDPVDAAIAAAEQEQPRTVVRMVHRELTSIPWREWQRRQDAMPAKVLIARRPWDSRVWVGSHEIHHVLRGIHVDQQANGSGELVLRIPLPLVELL